MSKSKDYVAMLEGFKDTDIRAKIVEYLDKCVKDRTNIVMGLSIQDGGAGTDFDKTYSYHDTIRDQIRFIERVMKKIPDTLIKQERARITQEEAEDASQIQAQLDAISEMTE